MSDIEGPAQERSQLPSLLALNPNYFGNLPGSELPSVLPKTQDTDYEELTCVSFDPQRNILEGTFQVKLPFGFGGDLCTPGTWEYLQFWIDYGGGWQDAGAAGVNVHDLPAGPDCAGAPQLPVSYSASVTFAPERNWCAIPVLPRVRAILSWQTPPPTMPSSAVPSPPDWLPVFGNVLECVVQVAPRPWLLSEVIDQVLADTETKPVLPPNVQAIAATPIPVPPPNPLGLADLIAIYMVKETEKPETGRAELAVPAHRFGVQDLQVALAAAAPDPVADAAALGKWSALGLNWQEAVAALLAALDEEGDITFEQLECVGLDNATNQLAATVRVKLPYGYNGNLCQAGSTEYVAFWADWGDSDCAYVYLGTAQIPVHDINDIPPEGLCYSALLPIDLSAVRPNCDEPLIGRVRAVLSWNVPPSTVDPDAVPFWGNRVDVHVQVRSRAAGEGTGPHIAAIGNIPTSDIDSTFDPFTLATTGSGLTDPDAHWFLSGLIASHVPCAFGGIVTLSGTGFPNAVSYRIQVRDLSTGTAWQSLTDPITVTDAFGGTSTHAPVGEYFAYLPPLANVSALLANFFTGGNDLWEIKLDARDALNNALGEIRYRIQLDNTAPIVDIHISSGAGDCKTFPVGTELDGKFVARDDEGHFGSYTIGVLPATLAKGTAHFVLPLLTPAGVIAVSGTTETSPAPGDGWALDTTGMQPCGYVAYVQAVDRTVVNSAWIGNYSPQAAVGFSLV